jgi:hypothetical protein
MNTDNDQASADAMPTDTPSKLSTPPRCGPDPIVTLGERWTMVADFQAKAMAEPDPLAKNVGVLNGDLLLLQHCKSMRLGAEALAAALPGGSEFPDLTELVLICRESDRFTKLYRALARPSDS